MAVASLIVSLSVNLFITTEQQEWFEKSALNNKTLNPMSVWAHCGLVVLFTVLTFFTVFDLREEAREVYLNRQNGIN